MDISVIIVNYNVKYFLEQCIVSLQSALITLNAEIFIVDNNSTDQSVEFIKSRFPSLTVIANNSNEGFAKANNKALQLAKGEFVLFLNPDTILAEDAIIGTHTLLKNNPKAGACGIRMIDGSGTFLKESKRGFPTAWVSFCKMSGLTKLFPRSSFFARYYMGHQSASENQEVDALSGAFMLVKKSVLESTGGFDERFFMYAEDIDLSYRIQQAGYTNHYFAGSSIIHFKGESTIKDAAYVKRFYGAMVQFVEKHQKAGASAFYLMLLKTAIKVRTTFALSKVKSPGAAIHPPGKFQIKGDTTSKSELIAARVDVKSDAGNIVFCTGPDYSYKDAIRDLENSGKSKRFYFHGNATSAIVGSNSKEESGVVIQLDKSRL